MNEDYDWWLQPKTMFGLCCYHYVVAAFVFVPLCWCLLFKSKINGRNRLQRETQCVRALLDNLVTSFLKKLFHKFFSEDTQDYKMQLYRKKALISNLLSKLRTGRKARASIRKEIFPKKKRQATAHEYSLQTLIFLLTRLCLRDRRMHRRSLEQIRMIRNNRFHNGKTNEDEVSEAEIVQEKANVINACICLGCDKDKLEYHSNIDIIPSMTHIWLLLKLTFKDILYTKFPRITKAPRIIDRTEASKGFIQRQEVDHCMYRVMQMIEKRQQRILVVAGARGVGKTELVKTTLNKLKKTFSESEQNGFVHFIWVDAINKKSVEAAFQTYLKLLHLDEEPLAGVDFHVRVVVSKVVKQLSSTRTIMVFDNVTRRSRDFLEKIIPKRYLTKDLFVLFTSQLLKWDLKKYVTMEIDRLSENAAVQFMKTNWKRQHNKNDELLTQIVNLPDINCVPSNLVTAVDYLNDNLEYDEVMFLQERTTALDDGA